MKNQKKNIQSNLLNKVVGKIFSIETLKNIVFFLLVYAAITWYMGRGLVSSGKPAPDFTLKDINAKEYSLSKLKGRDSILYFWATWCSVCKVNIPLLNKEASDRPDFYSIVGDGANIDSVKKVIKERGILFPVLLGNPKVLSEYRISSFPTSYFIDKKGNVVFADKGLLTPMGLWWRKLWTKIHGYL